jgi:hypothetical protein
MKSVNDTAALRIRPQGGQHHLQIQEQTGVNPA